MPAHKPAEIHVLFQAAFNAHDSRALSDLYEENAVLVTGPGKSVRGRTAIGSALRSFFAMKPVMRLETASVLEADGLALLEGRWVMTGVSGEGDPVQISGTSHEVVRRQADGSWLYLLDDPGAGR
jgi:uncharacterized protein (TIGR02246 family)